MLLCSCVKTNTTMVSACFKQKSTLVKCLIIVLVILVIVLVALFVNLVIRKDEHVCHTEHCIKAAAEIIKYIDQYADPCDDFHAFVCGNFIRNGKEPSPSDPKEELDSMIMNMLHPNDSKPLIAQKLFFQSCMNLGDIEMDQDETLMDLFYTLGNWPVLSGASWNGTFFEWTEVAIKSRRYGMKFDWFLNFSIYEDVNDTRTNMLKIDVPHFLKKIKPKEKTPRKLLMTKIAELMGAPKYLAHYEIAKTVEFEDELGAVAEKQRQRERDRGETYLSKLTIGEVQTLLNNINWLQLINNITGHRMLESDYIYFSIVDYVRDLEKLIMGTPKRIVADYMMWMIIEENWQFLSQPIRETIENYTKNVTNNFQTEPNRQKFCVDASKKQFPLVAESVYIQRHVTEQKRLLVREMLFIIQRHYMKLLEKHNPEMNRETRRESLIKLQNLKFIIAGPDEVYDEFAFAENLGVYGFAFSSSNIIDMLNKRRERFYDTYFSVINRMVKNNTVRFYEQVINITAFSVINHDTMVIPAAVLQDTFFTPNLPNYLNYGSLAKVLAREIFDYLYKNGTYRETANNERIEKIFEHPIKCLIKEFAHFHDSEMKRPEKMREHLADIVASEVAYESYNEWLHILPQESTLPGLNFNPHQLFWIRASKFLCARIYYATHHDRDHSRFKIIAPLKNSRHFADDFSCFDSSKMTSWRKCRIL